MKSYSPYRITPIKASFIVGALFLLAVIVPQTRSFQPSLTFSDASTAQESSVFRFWSPVYKHHFYTISETERDHVITNDPNWQYEGIAYDAYELQESGTTPLFRFYSPVFKGHFYTKSVEERDFTIVNDPNWSYEGIAYYVAIAGEPVYRFYSEFFQGHFYTTSLPEKEQLESNDPNWVYEGIAFYAISLDVSEPEPEPEPDLSFSTAYCGASHTQTFDNPPSGDFCLDGTTPIEQTGNGPWLWACADQEDVIVSLCRAESSAAVEIEVAECGTSVNACTVGAFVDAEDTSTEHIWGCVGSGGYDTFVVCSQPL